MGAILVTLGCQRPIAPQRFVVDLTLKPSPPEVGRVSFRLRLAKESKPVVEAAVMLEANMSHAGMSPSFARAAETAPGLYAGQIDFTMAGDWVILIHARLKDGEQLERQVAFPGVRPRK